MFTRHDQNTKPTPEGFFEPESRAKYFIEVHCTTCGHVQFVQLFNVIVHEDDTVEGASGSRTDFCDEDDSHEVESVGVHETSTSATEESLRALWTEHLTNSSV